MSHVELKIFPQALAWLAAGRLALQGDVAVFDGQPLSQPLALDALEAGFR